MPFDLAVRAAGFEAEAMKADPEVGKAIAEGEILLFERARDSGVTGAVRAAMRQEANTWATSAEPATGKTLEDYLKD